MPAIGALVTRGCALLWALADARSRLATPGGYADLRVRDPFRASAPSTEIGITMTSA
jgi:hypothetical protein